MASRAYSTAASGAATPSLSILPQRLALERAIQSMIDLLDTFDGDEDLEDDDPAGDRQEEFGEGPEWNPLVMPRYRLDQEPGPINFDSAMAVWSEKVRQDELANPLPQRRWQL